MLDNSGDNFNSGLAGEFVGNAVDLQRYGETLRALTLGFLGYLLKELRLLIGEADLGTPAAPGPRYDRLNTLLNDTKATIRTAYRDLSTAVAGELRAVAPVIEQQAVSALNVAFKADIVNPRLTPADLKALAKDSFVLGAPNKDWWAKQGADAYHRFATQVRMGYMAGETNDQIIARIIGKPTGRMVATVDAAGVTGSAREFAGGVMDLSRQHAAAQVITALNALNNKVMAATFAANQDILNGFALLVTLDLRTSQTCRGLSGGAWDFKGNPLPKSPVRIKYPGPPPYHFFCRTILIPVTKSWEELAGKPLPGIEEIPQATQSSMDGQVAGDLTYDAWLKGQSKARQLAVLGPGKWALWQSGKLGLVDMIDQTGNPLTLAELKAKAARKGAP